jgi:spermidine synthase
MAGWLKDGIINTDRNLKLQYLAGLGLNLYRSDAIYKAMIRQSKYPEALFVGSPETLTALKARIGAALGGAPN